MSPISNAFPDTGLKPLVLFLMSLTLAGCLSGGGGSSSNPPAEPPPVEEPENPQEPETPVEPEPEPALGALEFRTEQGIVGAEDVGSMLALEGLYYAKVPVRFSPPVPLGEADSWEGTREKSDPVTPCAQIPSSNNGGTFQSTNEDCLTLNVYMPAAMKEKPENADYPVMVWFHGGAFIGGSGNDIYPQRLVEEDVIVVSVNYRLGALGMISLPGLAEEQGDGYGNYSLMDQQEALRWININIENLGGDASNVTIFGQSAGGHSVAAHMLSPGATGLFTKAIIQSGSYVPTGSRRSFAEAKGQRLASYLPGYADCSAVKSDLECLREASIEDLLAAEQQEAQTSGITGYTPVPRTEVLPRSILEGLSSPVNQVPVMIGSTTGEGWLYANRRNLPDEASYRSAINGLFGVLGYPTKEVADYYLAQTAGMSPPWPDLWRYRVAYSRAYTDGWYACWTLDQAKKLQQANIPTWMYWFNETNPLVSGTQLTNLGELTTAHTLELPFISHDMVWDEWLSRDPAIVSDEAKALSSQMIDYWTEFAKSGDPNASGSAFWSNAPGDLVRLGGNLVNQDENTAAFSAFHQCGTWQTWGIGSP